MVPVCHTKEGIEQALEQVQEWFGLLCPAKFIRVADDVADLDWHGCNLPALCLPNYLTCARSLIEALGLIIQESFGTHAWSLESMSRLLAELREELNLPAPRPEAETSYGPYGDAVWPSFWGSKGIDPSAPQLL